MIAASVRPAWLARMPYHGASRSSRRSNEAMNATQPPAIGPPRTIAATMNGRWNVRTPWPDGARTTLSDPASPNTVQTAMPAIPSHGASRPGSAIAVRQRAEQRDEDQRAESRDDRERGVQRQERSSAFHGDERRVRIRPEAGNPQSHPRVLTRAPHHRRADACASPDMEWEGFEGMHPQGYRRAPRGAAARSY